MAGTPPLFLTTTYFYLFISTVITSISRQYPITQDLWGSLLFFIVSIGLLFTVLKMSPGPIKHVVFLGLLLSLGQMFGPLDKNITNGNAIRNTLVMVAGIFLGMTVLAFIDKGNFLGFGPYLFAGIIGLIVARLALTFYGYEKGKSWDMTTIGIDTDFKQWDKILSYIGVGIFALYTAYDTQILKKYGESLGPKGKPDYINASLDLYLDILNLFVNVEDIVS
jgi:FtsH-binding integral membrane protein